MIFWNQCDLKTSNAFVVISTLTQLYYVYGRLPTMNLQSASSILTHVVAKTFARIGILNLLHNWPVAYFHPPEPQHFYQGLDRVGIWTFGNKQRLDPR